MALVHSDGIAHPRAVDDDRGDLGDPTTVAGANVTPAEQEVFREAMDAIRLAQRKDSRRVEKADF